MIRLSFVLESLREDIEGWRPTAVGGKPIGATVEGQKASSSSFLTLGLLLQHVLLCANSHNFLLPLLTLLPISKFVSKPILGL